MDKAAMLKRIDTYVGHIDAKLVERVTSDTAGDCWDCKLIVQPDNVCMGDFYKSYGHLDLHMKERYYMGSMLANAWFEASGLTSQPPSLDALKQAVKNYLVKRLVSQELSA